MAKWRDPTWPEFPRSIRFPVDSAWLKLTFHNNKDAMSFYIWWTLEGQKLHAAYARSMDDMDEDYDTWYAKEVGGA